MAYQNRLECWLLGLNEELVEVLGVVGLDVDGAALVEVLLFAAVVEAVQVVQVGEGPAPLEDTAVFVVRESGVVFEFVSVAGALPLEHRRELHDLRETTRLDHWEVRGLRQAVATTDVAVLRLVEARVLV